MDWTVIVAAAIGGGLLTKVFDYLTTRQAARIDKDTKIQSLYEKTLDDMADRHDKEKMDWEKREMTYKKDIEIKEAQLEQGRQLQGEMLITIEDMKRTVNKVGADVQQITGDFGKYPLVNDREQYGRRASDKP